MWKRMMFMAPDEGNGAGGTEQAETQQQTQQQAPPEPSLKDVMSMMQQIAARQARSEEAMVALAHGSQQRQRHVEQDQDEDPIVQRLQHLEKMVNGKTRVIQDQVDATAYQAYVEQIGADPELQKQAAAVYDHWIKNGIEISGEPPTRKDALRYAAGLQLEQQRVKSKVKAHDDDQQRRIDNEDAVLERSGRVQVGNQRVEIDTLDRRDRIKHRAALLDKHGF